MRIQSLLIARIVWTSTLTLCSLYAGSAVYGAEPLHPAAKETQQNKLEDSLLALLRRRSLETSLLGKLG